ncbi:MAPK regulated corepressor interacting protein 2 isoform X2 [Microcaecilia unicolor]|uniref:MAPK regulated corepressor interacting protein 2 isoform X2 n=1 Tax=Microcaecilia unicolor TaxID=1415580 RepID=A0A6P7YL48_9AMPH|nr:MAPK regulated corepressor interacting protein 2 isoform X2 [Microcaecilia unicolor]
MMYTITRGPSKLATQRRTGPTQQIESKLSDLKCKAPKSSCVSSPWPLTSNLAPKLVFNRVNGKRNQAAAPEPVKEESYTLAHEENVRFVHEAWQEVEQQLADGHQGKNGHGPVQYVEKTANPILKNFVPIDLEEWWAQRFLANIENCS